MPEMMRAFFKFFGAKHRAVARYPAPEHELVVEPFAGSAAYATRHCADTRALLIEKDPIIAGLWRYLVRVRSSEVMRLPLLRPSQTLDDLKRLTSEQRTLIGFWLRTGSPDPRSVPSPWAKNPEYADRFWGEHARARVARQVERIRGWMIWEGSYDEAPDVAATWFIDPPYQEQGSAYRCGSAGIDYASLASWIKRRRGLAIACEQSSARWLDGFGVVRDLRIRSNVNQKGEFPKSSNEVFRVNRRGRVATKISRVDVPADLFR